ncbi:SWA2 [Symbiodinium natans]|uniref:alpha-amylase n=1 Tax=Symbiodinium natans TaxID=878477 RepID=A0A812QSP3_9DINO|nr:SWA2 [Symbiodinium natans]
MGFDCIWITPPFDSNGYMGYDAINLFEINPHFGTKADLKKLSQSLHNRGMCLVMDIVLNHMRSLKVNGKLNMSSIVPFDKPEYYHQRDRRPDQSFEDYLLSGPPPAFDGSMDSRNLEKLVKKKQVSCGTEHPEQTECSCFPGNMGQSCPSYNAQQQVEGWFGSLGDLNHSHPYVREQMLDWVTGLVTDYDVDAFRLDTAIYVDPGFVSEVQQVVGVEILGEATVNNLTYQANLMRDAQGERILTGLLNFPPFYQVPTAFCGYILDAEFAKYNTQGSWRSQADMTGLAQVMMAQLSSGRYESLDLMGNFADNHDEFARVEHYCKSDKVRIKNALTWVMMAQGIPIVYYGTEQGLSGHQHQGPTNPGQDALRESLWQTRFRTDAWQYRFLAVLNRARKDNSIGAGASEIKFFSSESLIFTRASHGGTREAWVFLNNANSSATSNFRYCPGPLPGIDGQAWFDAISGNRMDQRLSKGCFLAPDAEPKVLVLQLENVIIE